MKTSVRGTGCIKIKTKYFFSINLLNGYKIKKLCLFRD